MANKDYYRESEEEALRRARNSERNRNAAYKDSINAATRGVKQRSDVHNVNSRKRQQAPKKQERPVSRTREEVRRDSLKHKEQMKRRRSIIFIAVLILAMIVALCILSVTVFFNISNIDVQGKSQYTDIQITEASKVEYGDNLIRADKERIASNISEKLPFTGEITIKRSFPNTLTIIVSDSKISSAIEYNKKYYLLNDEYKVLAEAKNKKEMNEIIASQKKAAKAADKPQKKSDTTEKTSAKETASDKSESTSSTTATTTTTTTTTTATTVATVEDTKVQTNGIVIISGIRVKEATIGKTLVASNQKAFETYHSIIAGLKNKGVRGITAVNIANLNDITATYEDRIVIRIGSTDDLERKINLLVKVIEQQDAISKEQKGTIDLSIEGRAYFSQDGITTVATTEESTTGKDGESTTKAPTTGSVQTTVNATYTTASTTTVAGSTSGSTTKNDLVNTGG